MLPLQAFPALLDVGLLSARGNKVAGQNHGAKTLKLVMQSILVRNMEHCTQTRVCIHTYVFGEGAEPSHGCQLRGADRRNG